MIRGRKQGRGRGHSIETFAQQSLQKENLPQSAEMPTEFCFVLVFWRRAKGRMSGSLQQLLPACSIPSITLYIFLSANSVPRILMRKQEPWLQGCSSRALERTEPFSFPGFLSQSCRSWPAKISFFPASCQLLRGIASG